MSAAGMLLLLACSAAFLAGLQCASQRAGLEPPSAWTNTSSSSGGGGGGDAGGRKDSNQTLSSRLKRRSLAVDFAVPSLLRNYLSAFIQRPLGGDCRTLRGCHAARANLRMRCVPLQKIISTFADAPAPRNASPDGQLPFFAQRPAAKVLKWGSTESYQVAVEIGEDVVRTGCGGLSVHEEAPVLTLDVDLTAVLEWWLGAGGPRLRVRLMPEKKSQVAAVEDRYAAAIRAADPRLFFQIFPRGECPLSLSPLTPPDPPTPCTRALSLARRDAPTESVFHLSCCDEFLMACLKARDDPKGRGKK